MGGEPGSDSTWDAPEATPDRVALELSGLTAVEVAALLVQLAAGPICDPIADGVRLAAYKITTGYAPSSRDHVAGGRWHRNHPLASVTELDMARFGPTGVPDLWVRYGPAGPPAEGAA
ncbi:hypothetical protein [Pseudonocardia charpentierae]|uniref:Uncharacterized protein n=1 Tax=Pseudonocardia charpentierae TaxID=3075545 RepID=A0ABU2NJX0_9PSEU|nr:hypothetical protein [Pseudonocardia sp. DSM 45834]MDT0353728.1 hypothetical protein [Pseudonocardia sp. DSM 45834]